MLFYVFLLFREYNKKRHSHNLLIDDTLLFKNKEWFTFIQGIIFLLSSAINISSSIFVAEVY